MMNLAFLDEIFENIKKNLTERFQDHLKCLIFYGSWAKGTARENSDIDLLAILSKTDKDTAKSIFDLERNMEGNNSITLVQANLEDFLKEKVPLFTAVKKEGKVIYGDIDLSINNEPPVIKYAEFFKRSCEFEWQKLRIAEDLLKEDLISGIGDICFVASKHAIQAALAMKGEGYSSKVAVLLPLLEKHFGKYFSDPFRELFKLYVKSEYNFEFPTKDEAKITIDLAKTICNIYKHVSINENNCR